MSDADYYAARAAKHSRPKDPRLEPMREAVRAVLRMFPGSRIESYGEIKS